LEEAIRVVRDATGTYSHQLLHAVNVFAVNYEEALAQKSRRNSQLGKTLIDSLAAFFKPLSFAKVTLGELAEKLDRGSDAKEALRQLRTALSDAAVAVLRTDFRREVEKRDFWLRLAEQTEGRFDWKAVVAERAPRAYGLPHPTEPTARRVLERLISAYFQATLTGPHNGRAAIERFGFQVYSPTFSLEWAIRRLLPVGGKSETIFNAARDVMGEAARLLPTGGK